MKLSALIAGFPVDPLPPGVDPEVSGLRHDSRRVKPGDLYAALIGARFDGRVFAPEAAARGAVAVLASGPPPAGVDLPWLTTGEPRALLGPLAARLHDHPERELLMVGVTGTNGKSTVVTLVAAMLEEAGRATGVVGTLGYRLGGRRFAGERTTPEALDLFALLAEMREAGAQAVAMEVSSHALAQHRVAGVSFDVAAFINLSRDHFDYHRSFEDYFAAKRRLFDQLTPEGKAVVNAGDPYGRRLTRELELAGDRLLTFGRGGEVHLLEIELSSSGSRGVIATPRGPLTFSTPLLGRYNLDNLLAAVAVAEALDLPQEAMALALARQQPLPGRLEPVDWASADRDPSFGVYVDYAHTDAALAAALTSLRELAGRKVALVFGCGGDRDPGKRPLMGRVAGELADLPIATSDNPRSEDPMVILAAVEEGLKQSGNAAYRVIPDRRHAIRDAIREAGPEWVVLVAGKGHEAVQIVGGRELPFSDREEIVHALEERFGSAAHR